MQIDKIMIFPLFFFNEEKIQRLLFCRNLSDGQNFPNFSEQDSILNYKISILSYKINKQIMGILLNKILNSFSQMKSKILILGLDNAGKTTILYQMKLGEHLTTVPTLGFNVQEIKYRGLNFTVWDIGGQTKLINLWHHYFSGSDAVIYVLDSSDVERIQLAKETLSNVINHQDMTHCPVLVFANKMDISTLRPVEIVQKLGLNKQKRAWHLQPCCGLNGDGIVQGFQWLKSELKRSKK